MLSKRFLGIFWLGCLLVLQIFLWFHYGLKTSPASALTSFMRPNRLKTAGASIFCSGKYMIKAWFGNSVSLIGECQSYPTFQIWWRVVLTCNGAWLEGIIIQNQINLGRNQQQHNQLMKTYVRLGFQLYCKYSVRAKRTLNWISLTMVLAGWIW